MNRLFKRVKTKPTLFLIGSIITILYLITEMCYYLPRNGGESMYALGDMIYILLACLVMVIDWGLIAFINFKLVSVIEAAIILTVFLVIGYRTRTATIDITEIKKPYMILIDDPNGIDIQNFHRRGLFNKTLKIKDTDVIKINKASIADYKLIFKDPDNWEQDESIFSYHKPEYKYNFDFIMPPDSDKYTDEQRDSLVKVIIHKYL